MSHFTVFWPTVVQAANPRPAERLCERLITAHREGLREPSLLDETVDGGWILRVDRSTTTARRYDLADGWLVVTGSCLDLDSQSGSLRPEALLAALVSGEAARINRFEGTFAAAAWHLPTASGYALNDQTSNLNLYITKTEEGCWVTTTALPLAVALKKRLDPDGVRQFFARGTLLTPTSMFEGVRRAEIGEHLKFKEGQLSRETHWLPLAASNTLSRVESAAEALSDLAIDRTRRLSQNTDRVISDLTGGFDSRLVVSAAASASRLDAVTVDGPQKHGDVEIAKRVAAALQWELLHFDPDVGWKAEVDAAMRRELVYRVNGELPFADLYPHLQARPILAQRFGLHLNGGGGELMRAFPWSQEFFGIGRRRRANVENALSYRFFQEGPPPAGLFVSDWHPAAVDSFRRRLTSMFESMPQTLTTQQLDAAYLWRMTGFAPYTSAVASWLRSVAPLMCATTVTTAIGLPWKLRLGSRLVRTMIERQLPAAAELETRYGGTAGRFRLSTVHRQLWQLCKMGYHLMMKLDRVRLGGLLSKVLPPPLSDPVAYKPYRTEEFDRFLEPASMHSAALYRRETLESLLVRDSGWRARERMILRIATVEQLCRELDFRPDESFLD